MHSVQRVHQSYPWIALEPFVHYANSSLRGADFSQATAIYIVDDVRKRKKEQQNIIFKYEDVQSQQIKAFLTSTPRISNFPAYEIARSDGATIASHFLDRVPKLIIGPEDSGKSVIASQHILRHGGVYIPLDEWTNERKDFCNTLYKAFGSNEKAGKQVSSSKFFRRLVGRLRFVL